MLGRMLGLSMNAGAPLWNKFCSTAYPQGLQPEAYRQIKGAFYAGMICSFVMLHDLDEESGGDIEAGQKQILILHKEVMTCSGRPEKEFKNWLAHVYDGELPANQKANLMLAFFTGSKMAFDEAGRLSGDEADDEPGIKRLGDFKESLFAEFEQMAGQ